MWVRRGFLFWEGEINIYEVRNKWEEELEELEELEEFICLFLGEEKWGIFN